MEQYEVEEYVTEAGEVHFAKWLRRLKDKKGQGKLLARICCASFGNFGDYNSYQRGQRVIAMAPPIW